MTAKPSSDRRRAAPPGLRASFVELDGEQLLVLSHPVARTGPPRLSAAEQAIRDMLLEGKSYRAIAAARGTTVYTVRKQVHALYQKLGVSGRRELVARR